MKNLKLLILMPILGLQVAPILGTQEETLCTGRCSACGSTLACSLVPCTRTECRGLFTGLCGTRQSTRPRSLSPDRDDAVGVRYRVYTQDLYSDGIADVDLYEPDYPTSRPDSSYAITSYRGNDYSADRDSRVARSRQASGSASSTGRGQAQSTNPPTYGHDRLYPNVQYNQYNQYNYYHFDGSDNHRSLYNNTVYASDNRQLVTDGRSRRQASASASNRDQTHYSSILPGPSEVDQSSQAPAPTTLALVRQRAQNMIHSLRRSF